MEPLDAADVDEPKAMVADASSNGEMTSPRRARMSLTMMLAMRPSVESMSDSSCWLERPFPPVA